MIKPDSKKILNWEETIKLCNNNAELAKELIQMLRNDLPQQKQILLTASEKNDLRMVRDIIHQILGSCSYISLPELKEKAQLLHDALHLNETDFQKKQKAFIEAINATITSPLLRQHIST